MTVEISAVSPSSSPRRRSVDSEATLRLDAATTAAASTAASFDEPSETFDERVGGSAAAHEGQLKATMENPKPVDSCDHTSPHKRARAEQSASGAADQAQTSEIHSPRQNGSHDVEVGGMSTLSLQSPTGSIDHSGAVSDDGSTGSSKPTSASPTPARVPRLLLACGNGASGQLGIRGAGVVREPTETSSDILQAGNGDDETREVVSLSVSSLHTLLVTGDGVVWTCGSNEFGQLGRSGQSTRILRPLESLTQRIVQVCAGDRFSFARSDTGRLFSWGVNETGQLGQGHRDIVLKPRPVKDIPGNCPVRKVACGAQHVLAVGNAGELFVWGSSRFGQLGNGTYASSSTPLLCKFLTNDGVKDIACGDGHCVVLSGRNSLHTWGLNNFGQLGLGDHTNRLRPAEVTQLRVAKLVQIEAGSFHNVGITALGLVFTWGQGHRGQLGVGTDAPRSQPRPVVIEALRHTKIAAAAAGLAHTFFLSENRRLYVCGDNSNGQLGLPPTRESADGAAGRKQLFLSPSMCPLELQPHQDHLLVDQIFCGGNSSFVNLTTENGAELRRERSTGGGVQQVSIASILSKLEKYVSGKPGNQQIVALRKAILAGFSSVAVLNACTTANAHAEASGATAGPSLVSGSAQRHSASADADSAKTKTSTTSSSLGHNIGLRPDFTTLRQTYALIEKAGSENSAVPRTLGRALTVLVDALMKYKPSGPEDLVCYHALMECPLLLNSQRVYFDVFDAVMRSIMKLPLSLRRLFVEGCENYGPTHAKRVLQCLQHSISESALRGNIGPQVWRAASLLSDIRQYRQHFSSIQLDAQLFYNNELSERVNLEEEFKRWVNQGDNVFTICKYPFLLNPEAKRRLLRAEAHQYMSAAAYGARLRQFRRLHEAFQGAAAAAQHAASANTEDGGASAAAAAAAAESAAQAAAGAESDMLVLRVRRRFLLNDTLRELHRVLDVNATHRAAMRPINELQKPLVVHFEGEDGVDEGGLRKEFFQLLMKELLQPVHTSAPSLDHDMNSVQGGHGPDVDKRENTGGDSVPSSSGARSPSAVTHVQPARQEEHSGFFCWCPESGHYWFWPEKRDPPGAAGWLRDTMTILGTLFGLAAFNGILLEAAFPDFLYEMIVNGGILEKSGLQQKLDFVAQIHPSIAQSLKAMLQLSDDELEEVEQTFQISVETLRDESDVIDIESAGNSASPLVQRQVELKPGGADIAVTGSNRREFCDLYCTYLLEKSVAGQLQPFRSGFLQVVGGRVVSLCSAKELALMVSGTPLAAAGNGLRDLEEVTQYTGGFTAQSPTVRWFWQHVHSSETSDEFRRRLLLFTTGTDRIPIMGLRSIRFVIQRAGDDQNHLPVAHTCFNTLDLPEYATPAVLKQRLATALEHITGFGLV